MDNKVDFMDGAEVLAHFKPRHDLEIFSARMEYVLRENDHKGGWGNCSIECLFRRLLEEVAEVAEQIENLSSGELIDREAVKECCDVANFAMMLANQLATW